MMALYACSIDYHVSDRRDGPARESLTAPRIYAVPPGWTPSLGFEVNTVGCRLSNRYTDGFGGLTKI